MRQMVLEISHFKVRNSARWTSPFCRFLASLSLKYDVTDAILQDIEKMKVQYPMSLLFGLFEILQAVRSEETFRLILNFAAIATRTRIISLCSKKKDYCFLTIRRVYHLFSSKLDTTCSSNQTVFFLITF